MQDKVPRRLRVRGVEEATGAAPSAGSLRAIAEPRAAGEWMTGADRAVFAVALEAPAHVRALRLRWSLFSYRMLLTVPHF